MNEVKTLYLKVSDLKIDPAYQRTLSEGLLKKMGTYDPDLAGAIQVVRRRDGSLVVVDGQHRLVLARRTGIDFILAILRDSESVDDEAEHFLRLNTQRSAPKYIDLFNARLVAGDPTATSIREVAESVGAHIPRRGGGTAYKWPNLTALAMAEKVIQAGGHDLLRETLHTCMAAWPEDDRTLGAHPVIGVGQIIFFYGDHPFFSVPTLRQRLSRSSLTRFLQLSRELGDGPRGGKAMAGIGVSGPRLAAISVYNSGARNRLPELTFAQLSNAAKGRKISWSESGWAEQ